LANKEIESAFDRFFEGNKERRLESVSGMGSSLAATRIVREALPGLLGALDVRTLIDAPCGDYHWFSKVDYPLKLYLGIEIVENLVRLNRERHNIPFRYFELGDVTEDVLPRVDAIFCRDCMVHLPNELVARSIRNFVASGSRYLITTNFVDLGNKEINDRVNKDITIGQWRPISLTSAPFNLPPPIRVLDERSAERLGVGKTLSVWDLRVLAQTDIA